MFGLFDSQRSESERLLRLIREQQASTAPVDELLTRHRELVQSRAELPAWASNWAPHTASWISVLGLGPIAAGVTTVGAVTVALLLSPSAEPAPAPRQQEPPAVATAELPRVEPAPAMATEPAQVIAIEPAEVSPATVALKRRPTVQRAAIKGDESVRTSTGPVRPAVPIQGAEPSTNTAVAATASQPSAVDDETAKAEPAQPKPAEPERPSASYDPTVAEMREVAEAERLLSSDPKQALEMTRRMRAHYEVGYFAEERVYVEVMALQRLGRTDELRARAAEFLRTYPDGPYTARVRKALASASTPNKPAAW